MEERGNKTIMCTVMFLDIVAYSRKSVSAQIAQKELFNSILANAIGHVPVDDRVILDTGDGAAITFLGDVEDALKAALSFRDGLLTEGASTESPLEVRMGINLGPVRLVTDINGRPNIVGDGINVAQRIMGFAKEGQILVSRSYLDAASRLSQEYAGMFRKEGMRADKHDRVHEVYSIGRPGEAGAADKVGEDTLGLAVKLSPIGNVTSRLRVAVDIFMNGSPQQRALYAGIAATTLALLVVIIVKVSGRHEEVPAPEAGNSAPAVVAAASAVHPVAAAASAVQEAAPKSKPEERPAEEGSKSSRHKDSHSEKKKEHTKTEKSSSRTTDSRPAIVDFAIIPWGEVYLDDDKQGVSPPLSELRVAPGKHNIEIRNTTFPAYTLSIEVKAGERLKIKHKF